MKRKPIILLIEDDNLLQRMYQDKFEKEGYKVNLAVDGEEGLVKMKEERPDLVVLDVMMPNMNGFEVLENMKECTDGANIPVVLLTNLSGEEDAKKGLEMGAVAYLIKSENTPDHIAAKIEEILSAYTRDMDVPDVAVKK